MHGMIAAQGQSADDDLGLIAGKDRVLQGVFQDLVVELGI